MQGDNRGIEVPYTGHWTLVIEGFGQHHNPSRFDPAKDADNLADRLVREMLDAGQTVESATFTSGNRLVLPTHVVRHRPGGPHDG